MSVDIKELTRQLTNDVRVDYDDSKDDDNYKNISDIADGINTLLISLVAVANDIPSDADSGATSIKKMIVRYLDTAQNIIGDVEK